MANRLTISFNTCTPAPSNGYDFYYRPVGTSIAFRYGGNFTASPAIITDSNDTDGTQYEGYFHSNCGNGNLGPNVTFETVEPGDDNMTGMVCSDTYSAVHAGNDYFSHPRQVISIYEGTVTINWDSFDRPNRFTIYEDGVQIATSGWVGVAAYPGPWGMSLSTAESGSFDYTPSHGHLYEIGVEAGGADPENPESDNFNVLIGCEATVNSRAFNLQADSGCLSGNSVTVYFLGNEGGVPLADGTIIYYDAAMTNPVLDWGFLTDWANGGLYYSINATTGAVTFAGSC